MMHSNINQNSFRAVIKWRLVFLAIVLLMLPCSLASAFQSDQSEGARIFPASTNVFVQIHQPDDLIDKILSHPLREKIEALPPVKKALDGPQMKQGRIGLAFLETRIGEEWLPAIKKLTDNGVFVGADLKTQSVGVALRSGDEELLKKTAGEILGFIKQQAGDDAYEVESYRDGKFADFDDFIIARFGEWFIVSNKSKYAKQMADNLLDGVVAGKELSGTLATTSVFANAWKALTGEPDAWAFADLGFLRKIGASEPLFAGTTDNPGVELLFGGILEAVEDAEYVTASLSLTEQSIALKSILPFEAKSFREPREFYFGNQAMGRAPAPLELPGLLGQVTSYRDLGRWWLSKENLFPEKVIAELALVDSQFSTIFGGADFGEEILGALQPGLRIVVKEQDYPEGTEPDIKLPAFALVGRLQNPERGRRFKVSFNSFITLLNLNAGNSMPQFDVESVNEGDYKITSARYYVEDASDDGLIIYNFSPAIAFQDDYMIISSSEDFAHELAKATTKLDDDSNASTSNTLLTLNGAMIKKQLDLNKESLIAQSMVEGGKSREQATAEIDLALSLLNYAKDARLDYRIEPDQMVLDVQLDFQGLK